MGDDDEKKVVNVGAIDPVGVLHQQIHHMVDLTDAFKEKGTIRPIDYLRAMHAARENIEAVITITFSSIMSDAGDQVPEDVFDAHTREVQDALLGQTEEERRERIHKALMRVAKHIQVEADEDGNPIPPGQEKPETPPEAPDG
jgi:hypothetical protein